MSFAKLQDIAGRSGGIDQQPAKGEQHGKILLQVLWNQFIEHQQSDDVQMPTAS
jgi:hypothetical protein